MNMESAGELALEIGDLLFLDTDLGDEYEITLRADTGKAWESRLDVEAVRRDDRATFNYIINVKRMS